jgi:hypothetical protein
LRNTIFFAFGNVLQPVERSANRESINKEAYGFIINIVKVLFCSKSR